MAQTNIKIHFGYALKILRDKYNISREDLATRAAVAFATVYEIERGKRPSPGLLTVLKLLAVFPAHPYEILDSLGYQLQTEDMSQTILENRYLKQSKFRINKIGK